MSLNSVELLAPSAKSSPASSIEQLLAEQLQIAMIAEKDMRGLQNELEKLTRTFAGKVFCGLKGQSLPLLDQIVAQEGVVTCFSNTGRVRMAAEALLREVSEQRKIMLAFSKLLDGMEEKR